MTIDKKFNTRLVGKKGGFVDIHEKTDKNKKSEHIAASLVLADKGHQIQLMPEINANNIAARKFFFPELNNNSNPDARFNGVLGDFKIPDGNPVTIRSIQNSISSTARKGVSICVIVLLNKDYSMQEILSQIRGSLKFTNANKSIKEILLILKDKQLLRIPRGIATNKNFYKLINTL